MTTKSRFFGLIRPQSKGVRDIHPSDNVIDTTTCVLLAAGFPVNVNKVLVDSFASCCLSINFFVSQCVAVVDLPFVDNVLVQSRTNIKKIDVDFSVEREIRLLPGISARRVHFTNKTESLTKYTSSSGNALTI